MASITNLITTSTVLLAAFLPHQARAHTWIEEMQMINSNGSYMGDRGFSRGYMARTDPGFDGFSNMWMLPAIDAVNPDMTVRTRVNGSDLLCHPSQRTSNYTNPQYPMLKATAGGYIAMKYLENGHVTLPWTLTGKPANGGTVLIYGTKQPQPEEKMVDVMQWNEDGSGGDKRGFLMGKMDYDDGQCHQINTCWVSAERQILYANNIPGQGDAQSERWCESDIKIPKDVAAGKLAVYWVWDWGTQAGENCVAIDGKDEYYTNCADIEIVVDGGDTAAGNAKIAGEAAMHTLAQQDPNTQAVKNFASRTAVNSAWKMTTAANWADYNNKVVASPIESSFSAACQATLSAQAAAALADPNAAAPSCPPGSYAPTGAEYTSWSASIKANGAIKTTNTAAPATSAPATTAPLASTAPANLSAPASAASAPPQPSSGGAMGSVVTVTETQVTVSTLTTYMATPPASSPAAASSPHADPAPSAPAAAPPAEASPPAEGNAGGYPTISVISDSSAAMTASAAPAAPSAAGGAPYNVTAGRNGMGGEHQPRRRHARDMGRTN